MVDVKEPDKEKIERKNPLERGKANFEKPNVLAFQMEGLVTNKGNPGTSSSTATKLALRMGGCNACPFLGTYSCPYFPAVNKHQIHKDGYCGKFKMVIQAVSSGQYVGLTKQKQYLNLLKDQLVMDHLHEQWKDNPEKIPKEMLSWSMHVQDTLAKIRRQEEGSKLSVKKDLSPAAVLAAIRAAEKPVVDAEFEEVDGDEE